MENDPSNKRFTSLSMMPFDNEEHLTYMYAGWAGQFREYGVTPSVLRKVLTFLQTRPAVLHADELINKKDQLQLEQEGSIGSAGIRGGDLLYIVADAGAITRAAPPVAARPAAAAPRQTSAPAAAAAAAAAMSSAQRRHGKKNKIFSKTWKTKKLRTRKFPLKFIQTSILEALGKNRWRHQILREKLLCTDLFSSLYDRKWPKTLNVHVFKHSYMSKSYAVVSLQYCVHVLPRGPRMMTMQ